MTKRLIEYNLSLVDISEASMCGRSVRYAEVKARARSGAIRISSSEWKKARHFDDKFWLYVVTDAGTDAPWLHRIHDSAAHFRMDEDIFSAGFIIPEDSWRAHKVGGEDR